MPQKEAITKPIRSLMLEVINENGEFYFQNAPIRKEVTKIRILLHF